MEKYQKLSKKDSGIATNPSISPTIKANLRAFLCSYPPTHALSGPLTMAPAVGLVAQTIPKAIYESTSLTPRLLMK